MKRHFKKYWFIYLLIFLFIAFVVVCLFNREFYLYLFDSPDHKFQWVGATSIIAIITLAVNAWDNRRKFKADLISKSRIAWIENVRRTVAEFQNAVDDIYYWDSLTKTIGFDISAEKDFIKARSIVKEKADLLRFYFNGQGIAEIKKSKQALSLAENIIKSLKENGDTKGKNAKIISLVQYIAENYSFQNISSEELKLLSKDVKELSSDDHRELAERHNDEKNYKKIVSKTMDIISMYLKIEWDRAKKGE